MKRNDPAGDGVSRFMQAWLGVRQLIQAANFNRFQKAGLSATQFMTLNLMPSDASAMTLSELARRLNLANATVAKTIDSLESRGLITRTRSSADRRNVLLAVTPAGAELQNAAANEFHRHMESLFARIPAPLRTQLTAGLEALLEAGGEDLSRADAVLPAKRSAR